MSEEYKTLEEIIYSYDLALMSTDLQDLDMETEESKREEGK